MSDLRRRFKFYGLGILLGTFFVILLFGRRSSCRDYIKNYMPNGRVLAEMKFLPINYTPEAFAQASQFEGDTAFVNQSLIPKGIIDFERSAPRDKPCGKYILNYTDSINGAIEVYFIKCKEYVEIQSIKAD